MIGTLIGNSLTKEKNGDNTGEIFTIAITDFYLHFFLQTNGPATEGLKETLNKWAKKKHVDFSKLTQWEILSPLQSLLAGEYFIDEYLEVIDMILSIYPNIHINANTAINYFDLTFIANYCIHCSSLKSYLNTHEFANEDDKKILTKAINALLKMKDAKDIVSLSKSLKEESVLVMSTLAEISFDIENKGEGLYINQFDSDINGIIDDYCFLMNQ